MPDVLVHARGLTRHFGARVAVSDVSFEVPAGEIVALLGPNGAGKTTTLRMLAGLIPPHAGDVRVEGRVGFLTETPGLWERLSVRLNLLTYARLHGLDDPHARVEAALALVDLGGRAGDRAGELSKGLKQRVALARALVHDPRVVLLDEPTAGLDPVSARQVRDLIASLARRGCAVLVSTHNLAEAEALADRVAVLRTRLLALAPAATLRGRLTGVRVEIDVQGPADAWTGALRAKEGVEAEAQGSRLVLTLEDGTGIPEVVGALVAAGARIERVAPERRSLEDVYVALMREEP